MGEIAAAFNTAFRAWQVDGVPGSGANPPEKAEARALGGLIEAVIGAAPVLATLVGAAHTLTLDHWNAWLEISHSDTATITVPADADVAFPILASVYGAQAGVGSVVFEGAPGVTVLCAENQEPSTACPRAVWELTKIDTDTWQVFGNLTAV